MKKIALLALEVLLLAALLVMATGCGKPEWIVATGYGAPDPNKPAGQAKLLAKRAAKMDATRALLEQVKGIKIDSNTTVKDFMTKSDSISSDIDGLVKGAQVIAERVNDDGTAEVDIRIDAKKVKKLIK